MQTHCKDLVHTLVRHDMFSGKTRGLGQITRDILNFFGNVVKVFRLKYPSRYWLYNTKIR
ncbi:uncharacterized protein METZ01_LOCUS300932, partial [marine metagenome]